MMKKTTTFTALMLLLMCGFWAQAQDFNYHDSWGKSGITLKAAKSGGVSLNYSMQKFSMEDITVKGESMKNIQLPGTFLFNDEGAPNLPGMGQYIAIPTGAKATVKITAKRIESYKNINLAPAPRIPLDTEDGPMDYSKNNMLYNTNAFYPAEPVKLSEVSSIRGVESVILGITPYQYNPVTRELIVYRDLQIDVEFEGGQGTFGEDRLRSRWFDPILSDMMINYSSLPKVDYDARAASYTKDTDGCEYLVITPTAQEFQNWADSVRVFRNHQGILTKVMTIEEIGGNNTTAMETFFNDAFNNWTIPPVAVLLMGDYGSSTENRITSPVYNNYCVSDNIFADVSGNHMPDIIFARMTAQNEGHLETMVNKFMDYERNPPMDANYYNHPITALGWQTERWFQLCSETVGGFLKNELNKEPVRINAIYQGNPGASWSSATNTAQVVSFFGPDGLGYIPATPAELGGFGGGTPAQVTAAINAGSFMLQHRDHGGEDGWGEPGYNNSHIDGLNNSGKPTFIFSINCLTGKYNISGECFAEKFHRHTNGGALGLIAASEVSYSFVNDTYVWGMYDNMWPEFMPDYNTTPEPRGILPGFGNASGKYFLEQSNWPYNTNNKEVTYYLFHLHGDAFMTMYSEVPQDLTVNHNPALLAGTTSFEVTADDGALIALTVDDNIIGTAIGTGSPVSVNIEAQVPPTQVRLVVTKQNFHRYEKLIDVIPPEGPYVVRHEFTINDADANNNGMLDYGEEVKLNFSVKNVGVALASNVDVTLSTTDSHVTITDNAENYGDIAADEVKNIDDAFTFSVSNDVPDNHNISFKIEATNGTDIWESNFSIKAHAPVLNLGDVTIDDATGNDNGRIDPGETVDLTIVVLNDGSADAAAVAGTLNCSDPYITVNSSQVTYGAIVASGNASKTFSITADDNTPTGHLVQYQLNITAEGDITGSGTFTNVVGQVPALVVDLDGNHNSGNKIQATMQALGVSCEMVTSLPTADLDKYTSIFVSLGVYSNNHALTNAEGQLLADYMTAGGCVYMEGGDTWKYDSPTAAHAMFSITPQSDGSGDLSTIAGQTGTFTDGLSFSYNGDNSYIDQITNAGSAQLIFKNSSPSYGTAVANDGGTYKTIGASHEFGGLTDNGANTKEALMIKYLEFFGITPSGIIAQFEADVTEICEDGQVAFTDLSTPEATSWAWTFEGGNPATSTDQNPTVTYATAGTYDVTLIATNEDGTNSSVKYDYITVLGTLDTPAIPSGDDDVCVNLVDETTYTVTDVAHATGYEWIMEPASAGTITENGNAVTINWEEDYVGTVTLKVRATNDCGNSEYSDALDINAHICDGIENLNANLSAQIFPNPNNGNFNLNINGVKAVVNVKLVDMMGNVVLNMNNIHVNKNYNQEIKLNNLAKGIYCLHIEGKNIRNIQKVIIK